MIPDQWFKDREETKNHNKVPKHSKHKDKTFKGLYFPLSTLGLHSRG